MVKSIGLLKKKEGITQEQFLRHWKEIHGPIALKYAPGLRRYVQNHPVNLPGAKYPYDGIAELWFDDVESALGFSKWLKSDAGKIARDDIKLFADRMDGFMAEEIVLRE